MEKTSQELNQELNDILSWFESDDFDIDKATEKYEKGQSIIKELNTRLKNTKNQISNLKVNLD